MKKLLSLFSLLFLLSVIAMPQVQATSFRAGEELNLAENFVDDVYIAGGKVVLDSDVQGDLIAAGGEVTITGEVNEDLVVVGGKVSVAGNIEDDLRIGGGEINILGSVGDDALLGGGKVVIAEGAIVNGNLVIGGGEITIDGQVNGNLKVQGGKVVINGAIIGDSQVFANEVVLNGVLGLNAQIGAMDINLGSKAVIAGDLEYWQASGEADMSSVVQGIATFSEDLQQEDFQWFEGESAKESLIYSLLTAAFLIFILRFVFPNFFNRSSKTLDKSMGTSLMWGLAYFVLMPVLILVLFISIIGIPVALLFLFIYLFSFYLAKLFAAVIFANMANNHYKLKMNNWMLFGASIVAYLVLYFLPKVPVIGWIAVMVAVLMAFGALLQEKKAAINKVR